MGIGAAFAKNREESPTMEAVVSIVTGVLDNRAYRDWPNERLERFIMRIVQETIEHEHRIIVRINKKKANIFEGPFAYYLHGHIVVDRKTMLVPYWRNYGAPRGPQNCNPAVMQVIPMAA